MNNFKIKMNEKIKLYSNNKYLDGYIKNEFLTDDDDADIFLSLKNKDELLDSRTLNNQLDLVSDIYEFIDEKTAMLNNDTKIHLHIIGLKLNPKEQEMVKHIIKEHYAIELYKAQKAYLGYKNKIFKLIVMGIIFLISYALLYIYTNLDFCMEIFGFLFSFSLWEAFDCLIYPFNDAKKEREAITQNLLINVDFESENNV